MDHIAEQFIQIHLLYKLTETGQFKICKIAHVLVSHQVTFEVCRSCVDSWILVSEHEIAYAVYSMMEKHHKVMNQPGVINW